MDLICWFRCPRSIYPEAEITPWLTPICSFRHPLHFLLLCLCPIQQPSLWITRPMDRVSALRSLSKARGRNTVSRAHRSDQRHKQIPARYDSQRPHHWSLPQYLVCPLQARVERVKHTSSASCHLNITTRWCCQVLYRHLSLQLNGSTHEVKYLMFEHLKPMRA